MELCNYQKIIIDGNLVQEGMIDTITKFEHLSQGIDFTDKTVLDVGCNTGMLGYLATQQGAIHSTGIDIDREVIKQASQLFPNQTFRCEQVEEIYGNYDIIIASGMLHYITDIDKLFMYFARCAKEVLCDIWLYPSEMSIFALSHRGIYIPSRPAFEGIVGKYFNKIEAKGKTISPDQSERFIYQLSDPIPNPPEAILISGVGGVGKTTLAQTYFVHRHLMTDNISAAWRDKVSVDKGSQASATYTANAIRGSHIHEYLNFFISSAHVWLTGQINRDIVIEGYELCFFDFKLPLADILRNSGWVIKEIKL